MHDQPHAGVVADQFGAQAQAYVQSTVHAQGEDLARLADLVRGRPAARVLDLGCGGGHVSYAVTAAMLEAVAAEAARRGLANIRTRQGAAEALPFEDASFDYVFCRFSAHHWQDFAAGLREARRVLRAGGQAVFVDVISPGQPLADTWLQCMELLRDPSHVRDYSLAEWLRATAEAGFAAQALGVRRLRMDFASWIARMRTPPVQAEAIRALQARMAKPVRDCFAVEDDGSFTLDSMSLELAAG